MTEFKDNITKNYLKFHTENTIVWLDEYYVDENDPKLFVALLQTSIQFYIDAGFKKFSQWVSDDDWNGFLHKISYWKIILINPHLKCKLIECDLSDAAVCLVESFFA